MASATTDGTAESKDEAASDSVVNEFVQHTYYIMEPRLRKMAWYNTNLGEGECTSALVYKCLTSGYQG
jgi:hypothetical protein